MRKEYDVQSNSTERTNSNNTNNLLNNLKKKKFFYKIYIYISYFNLQSCYSQKLFYMKVKVKKFKKKSA